MQRTQDRNISNMMLKAIVQAYIDESCRLYVCEDLRGSESHATESIRAAPEIYKESIAKMLFPKIKDSAAKLARLLNQGTGLHLESAENVLAACSKLLRLQCTHVSKYLNTNNEQRLDAVRPDLVEHRIASRLGLRGAKPMLEDLFLESTLESANSVRDLGFDDLYNWSTRDVWRNTGTLEASSGALALLERICLMPHGQSMNRRVQLARIALTLAFHHYPDTPHHQDAIRMVVSCFERAGIYSVGHSNASKNDIALHPEVLRLQFQLDWLRVHPTQHSRFNFHENAIAAQKRIGRCLSDDDTFNYEQLMLSARRRASLYPNDPDANSDAASVFFAVARAAIATEGESGVRRVRNLVEEARRFGSKAHMVYSHQYDILECIVRDRVPQAGAHCESAIQEAQRNNDPLTTSAYSALLYELSISPESGLGTTDAEVVKRARAAVQSPQVVYMFSHLFSENRVRDGLLASQLGSS